MSYRGRVLTGARARFSLDGAKLGLSTNVTYSEEIQHEPVEPLDQFEVAEHVEVAYRVTLTAQLVRIVGNAIKNRDGVVVIPRLRDILRRGEMTATIEDNHTGILIANIERVKGARYTINVGARGIVLTDVEFNAIKIKDESEFVD
jgi:hypothetical protein